MPALDAQRRSMIQRDGSSLLCVEFYGDRLDDLRGRAMEAVERDLEAQPVACRIRHVIDLAKQAKIWSFREAALGLSTAMKCDGKAISFVEDTAVAPEKLRDYIARFIAIVQRHRTTAGVYAHASVGCLHVRPVVNLKTADGVATFEAIANEVADLVLEFGGALSGEHGDGLVRGAFNEKMFGSELYQAFRAVKRTFDPNGLFNPGRIVDTPPITSHLRFGAGLPDADAGHLLRLLGARRLWPRGRDVQRRRPVPQDARGHDVPVVHGDARRGALDARPGQRAAAGDDRRSLARRDSSDQGVHEVLDLCLECRACKSECPVGVDVARFKSEFLAGYWERHRLLDAARMRSATRMRHPRWAAASRRSRTPSRTAAGAMGHGTDHRRRSPANVAAVDEAHAAKAARRSRRP